MSKMQFEVIKSGTTEKVEIYLVQNRKYFPSDKIAYLKEKLEAADSETALIAMTAELKNPTLTTVMSIFFGGWGVDRFMNDDIGMGILKILTAGCCGVLTVIDWFISGKKTKEINFNNVMAIL